MNEHHSVSRVKWASEPDVVEVAYDDDYEGTVYSRPDSASSMHYPNNSQKTPLKSSLKRSSKQPPPPHANVPLNHEDATSSPTPRAVELLGWANTRHSIITSIQQEEDWREHGSRLRARLVRKDEQCGGNTFTLSNNCKIERYFDVAERVLEQFLSVSVNDTAELTESYLVGNRLVKFLCQVLPRHENYFSGDPNIWELRTKSQKQLVQLLLYLERLALVIDEDEYNKYILSDLETKESNKEMGSPGENSEPSTAGRTADTAELSDIFVDDSFSSRNAVLNADEADISAESSALFPYASFTSASPDESGYPQDSLLADTDQYASEEFRDVLDSSFTKQSLSRLFVGQNDKIMPRSSPPRQQEAPVHHSNSWDDSFMQFAQHHEHPPRVIKKNKTDKIRRTSETQQHDAFDVADEWGDEWSSNNGSEQQSQDNVFRQQKPRDVDSRFQQDPKQASLQTMPQHKSLRLKKSPKPQYVHPMTMQPQQFDHVSKFQERQQSPKSIADHPTWVFWDEASSSIAASATSSPPMISSTYAQLSTHEFYQYANTSVDNDRSHRSGEETQSLTRGVVSHSRSANGRMRHFKGCVRCFMEPSTSSSF